MTQDNMLNEWLGIDLVELAKHKDVTDEKRKEITVAIVKLTEYPEWTVFEAELQRLLKEIDKPCETYANSPEMAKYDAGQKRTIQVILNFVKNSKSIIEQYAKRKEQI